MDIEYIKKLLKEFDNKSVYNLETALLIYEFFDKKMLDITDKEITDAYNFIHSQDDIYSDYVKENIKKIEANKDIDQNIEKLRDVLDNYCENCSDQEWNDLLDEYEISDNENYMGEVRENLEDAVISKYESISEEQQIELLNKLSKYNIKEIEEEIER